MKLFKIFIDVGHGGKDSGAVFGTIIERDINLIVALKLADVLKDYASILMSRTDNNTYLSLEDRAKMANDWNADLVVSVHHNAGKGDGYEIIHSVFTELTIGDELSQFIGLEFEKLGQNKRRIFSRWNSKYNENYYGMIRNCKMDSIITEFAFVDSDDNKAIDSYDELLAEGLAIANGIIKFFELENINMKWNEILEECLSSPDGWINTVTALKEMANLQSNLGDLELCKYLDILIEKVYEFGKNQA